MISGSTCHAPAPAAAHGASSDPWPHVAQAEAEAQPFATTASARTIFEAYPAVLDPAAASIAATASAQDLRTFWDASARYRWSAQRVR